MAKKRKRPGAKPKARATRRAQPRAVKAKRPTRRAGKRAIKRARKRAAAPSAARVRVTMTIGFGPNAPSDVMSVGRIDGSAVSSSGQAAVNQGEHTTSWDVLSPTIRPIPFTVTITEDATGRKLLNRAQERTGSDGKGGGADTFTV